MHTRMAATVAITASLAVLMSGCAGAAALGGQVRDDLRPAANAAVMGLARGHVIVRDDLSPTRLTEESISQAVQAGPADAARAWSAEARREFHSAAPQQALGATTWSADALREFHATSPQQALGATTWSADALREFHAQQPGTITSRKFSPEAIRELKAGAPVGVTAAEMQGERLSAYAEAQAAADVTAAEMQGARLSAYAEARTDAAIRELKGSAPVDVRDDLSPLGDGTSTSEQPADTVDDDQSPTGGSY
jgi:hypothetical protein